jgi:hypothetical protein
MLRRIAAGTFSPDDHVRDGEPASWPEYPKRFREDAVLIPGEVNHTVRDDDIDGVVRERDALDVPFRNSTFVTPALIVGERSKPLLTVSLTPGVGCGSQHSL